MRSPTTAIRRLRRGERDRTPGECVLVIDHDNKTTQIWTIVATSPTNGPWDW